MKTLPDENQLVAAPVEGAAIPSLQTFSATLNSGKTITIREMTGKDLIYMEEELSDMKETRRSFHLIERLNVGSEKITYEDIEKLGVRDIRAITELVEKANGEGDTEGQDPK